MSHTDPETLGERVHRLRRRSGLEVRELAKQAGVGTTTIARIEAGTVIPREDTLTAIARALKVSERWLQTGR